MLPPILFFMNRSWNILNWNVRGINSTARWNDIRKKNEESACCIMTFQETKRDIFDSTYIKNFCPKRCNQYCYSPSNGSSGGLITIWNGSLFSGTIISQSSYQITIKLLCNLSGHIFYIRSIYGPCQNEEKIDFFDWLNKFV